MRLSPTIGILCVVWLVAGIVGDGNVAEPQAPPATGVIAGTMTGADTGRPLRRVRVSLTNSETNANLGTAVTDPQGRFSFTKLPAASFTLKASKTGYLDVTYGQKKLGSGRPGTSIQLAEGQKIDTVALQMPRSGVISGMVTDEVGDPAYNVTMRAMKYVLRNGLRELAPAGSAATDDRGHYRIAMLVPGEYIVCAAPRDEFVDAVARYEDLRSRSQQAMAGRASAALGPPPEEPKEAYVTVCVPGTTQMSSATTLTLDVSEERAGNDVQLQIVPITKISGTVSWGGGALPIGLNAADTSVWLVDQASIFNPAGQRVAKAMEGGRFSFTNVTPGQYTLVAQADAPVAQASAGGLAGQKPAALAMTTLWAGIDVTVTGQPISDLTLSMATGMSVSGRVVVEGAAPVDLTKLRLTAYPAGPTAGEMAATIGQVEADGRFTISGVVPGRYRIVPYQSASFGAVIKSSVFNGADTLDFPIEVKGGESLSDGVVTMIPRLAEITGQLQNGSNQPVAGYTLIVFAAEPRYWTPMSRRIQAVRSGADGRFTLKDLPAGDYRLAAVTDVESGQWFDPAFLRDLVANAITVSLAEGEHKDQMMRLVR